MKNLPKTLRGSLSKLQRIGVGFYQQCATQFRENQQIHEAWTAMARDLEQQEDSLRGMPALFWRQLKEDENEIRQAIHTVLKATAASPARNGSLRDRLAEALDFEEAVTLQVCVPLIRRLRTHWTDHSLGFYILVKAHAVRVLRIVQPYSGDPALIRRALSLLDGFETGVQRPPVEVPPAPRRRARPKKKAVPAKVKPRARIQRKSSKPIRERAKPLVKPLKISRRRARR